MNTRFFHAILFLILALFPALNAQEKAFEAGENKFPSRGVRFVICSSTNERLPSPMYAKVGKEYLPVHISARMPSPRVTPEGGVVKFYETKPQNPKTAVPDLTIEVPKEHSSKSLCIIQPLGSGNKPRTYFLKESEFARNGVYIINFSPTTLRMRTSTTGDFEEADTVTDKIAPYRKSTSIAKDDPNTWSYMGKSKKGRGETVSFVLDTMPATPTGTSYRIRASKFITNKMLSQISIVVPHPNRPNTFDLISVQFNDDADRLIKEQGAPPGKPLGPNSPN